MRPTVNVIRWISLCSEIKSITERFRERERERERERQAERERDRQRERERWRERERDMQRERERHAERERDIQRESRSQIHPDGLLFLSSSFFTNNGYCFPDQGNVGRRTKKVTEKGVDLFIF